MYFKGGGKVLGGEAISKSLGALVLKGELKNSG